MSDLSPPGLLLPPVYNMTPIPQPPIPAGRVPVALNPAAELYGQNSLLPYSDPSCSGCYLVKADPRVREVKPMYVPNHYDYTGPVPNAYNVRGMY